MDAFDQSDLNLINRRTPDECVTPQNISHSTLISDTIASLLLFQPVLTDTPPTNMRKTFKPAKRTPRKNQRKNQRKVRQQSFKLIRTPIAPATRPSYPTALPSTQIRRNLLCSFNAAEGLPAPSVARSAPSSPVSRTHPITWAGPNSLEGYHAWIAKEIERRQTVKDEFVRHELTRDAPANLAALATPFRPTVTTTEVAVTPQHMDIGACTDSDASPGPMAVSGVSPITGGEVVMKKTMVFVPRG